LATQIFGDKKEIAIGGILIWCSGGVVLDAKWMSSLVCKVITFMAIFRVQKSAMYLTVSRIMEIPMIHTPSTLRRNFFQCRLHAAHC